MKDYDNYLEDMRELHESFTNDPYKIFAVILDDEIVVTSSNELEDQRIDYISWTEIAAKENEIKTVELAWIWSSDYYPQDLKKCLNWFNTIEKYEK